MNMSRFKPYYAYRAIKWKLGDRSPLNVGLLVTGRCQLNCDYCPWGSWKADELSTERWCHIMDRLYARGVRIALFIGGEPTLRRDLQELIEHANNLGMITELFTNGIKDLSGYTPTVFYVSIDGIGKVHDRTRGIGNFSKTVNNMKKIEGRKIVTWTTVTRENMNRLHEICEYFDGKVRGMAFNYFYPYEGVNDMSLSRKELVRSGSNLLRLKREYNIINSKSFLTSLGKNYKVYPWMSIWISPDGNMVQGCQADLLGKGHDCSRCFQVCCRETALAINMRLDAIQALSNLRE